MAKERQNESCIVDDEDRISGWLCHATLNEYDDDVDELGDAALIDPVTPTRRPLLPEYYDEVSPTDTSFSGGSIFDTPPSPVDGWIEDVFGDDLPDKVSSDGLAYHRGEYNDSARLQLHISIDHVDSGSHASYDPPSEVTADLERETEGSSAAVTIPHIDRDKPRPTWLTSCTQCIHAYLPCSRKAPACSRCRRKGQAALCLLHRRPYPEEILKSDASWSTTLKLLRLKDEDEDTWKEKLRLEDQVCRGASHTSMTDERQLQENWSAQNYQENWVLPSIESPRGDFRSNRIRVVKAYPGEGRGECKDRFSYQELCVTMDD